MVEAYSDKGYVYIVIADDGNGIDIKRVFEKAKEKNLVEISKNYSEIQKGTQEAGLDMNTLTGGVSEEIAKAKEGITKMVNPMENINLDVQNPIEKVKEDIENITGPIKRQM